LRLMATGQMERGRGLGINLVIAVLVVILPGVLAIPLLQHRNRTKGR
jgi:hypothetical protein